jgi:hypothetical protein
VIANKHISTGWIRPIFNRNLMADPNEKKPAVAPKTADPHNGITSLNPSAKRRQHEEGEQKEQERQEHQKGVEAEKETESRSKQFHNCKFQVWGAEFRV